jgi:YHS domain-containing protein
MKPLSANILLSCTLVLPCSKPPKDVDHTTTPPPPASSTTAPDTPSSDGLVRVEDPSLVCMVNDRYMGKAQIPVDVGGKRYFGCCAGCKQKLEADSSARLAVDPVSGERVDKASAVIARNTSGKVLYFSSDATLRRYR